MKNFGEWIIEVLEWFTGAIRSFPSRYYTDYTDYKEAQNDTDPTDTERDTENIKTGGV